MTVPAPAAGTDHGVPTARRRPFGVLLGLIAGLALMGAIGAPSAFAHTELESSNPADGGTVEQVPTSIQLVFADTVRGADPVFTITVAGAAAPVEAPAVIDGATVTADLSGVALPTATYPASWEVAYRLVALDGDAFRGDITFTVTTGPTPAPATSALPETSTPVSTAAPTTEVTVTGAGSTTPSITPSPSSPPPSSSPSPSSSQATASSDLSAAAPGTAATTTAGATTVAAAGGGAGWWWFGGVVVVALVAGGGYWYARSRRTTPPAA